jgi:hypothetical protein
MILEAIKTVKTTGINFDSISVIAGIIIAMSSLIIAYVTYRDRKIEKRQEDHKDELARITQSNAETIAREIGHLSDVLVARLETKENVYKLAERVARIEAKL